MQLHDIIYAWNSQIGEHNQWDNLNANEMINFTLYYIENKARDALDDLGVAVYFPEKSGISVAHAINHIKQIFYTNKLNI